MASIRHGATLWCSLFVVFAFVAPTAAADKTVMSNMELMSNLASEATTELIDSVPSGVRMSHVVLAPYQSDEHYEFIDNVFVRVLTSNGHKVYTKSQPTEGAWSADGVVTLRLEYRVLNFDLSYPKIYRPFLIGGKKVKRTADIKLLAKLVDPSDESVVWIGEAERSFEDQFAYGQLSEVEAGRFDFTKPPRSTTKWGKVIEPVVVSGIIIGLIYLFFSNQSDS